ncbi:M24 family metallopeptidase [Lederbergia galactosidilytica]|uniref:Metallopeptidase n=1 Tax=Lederbergia galactosidilytica TaxID=217031 RepID=A0A0Q9Y3N4_9BACI|nr:metallopeptidase [Lederbergia galactosidilytica]KRG14536.1 metallopeptidase [Virgibacillus soli]OAK68201.1 metallopeptidase [Lederbergia galactosidilytica]
MKSLNRLKKLSAWLSKENIEAAFITSPDNIFYLTGFRSEPHERLLGLVVFQEEEPFIICPAMEKADARAAGWEHEIIGYQDTDQPWDFIEQAVKARISNIRQWAVEKNHMNVSRYEELQSRFSSISLQDVEPVLNELRMLKTAQELEYIQKACELADFAVEVGVSEIAEGKTELDIIAAIEYEVKKKGVSGMSFDTMVLTGINAASPHGTPGMTKIKKGDFVLFDLGVIYEGYCSDITRTVAFGEVSVDQEKIYQTVLQAQEAAVNAVKPGILAKQLDKIARDQITNAGYGEYFPHRLGHGLGISVHEYPSITATNPLRMTEGMVFTIEPGIYVPSIAGVRIEDDLLVTKEGVETLTKYPKSLQII